jgi:hypothetical protein
MKVGWLDALRIVRLLPEAEICRRLAGPAVCLQRFRARGLRRAPRSADVRQGLRRLIHAIDRRLPDGGNCLRRALVEIALDPVAAAEPVHFGLVRHGGPKSGHAWLDSDRAGAGTYDAVFTM